VVLESNEGNNCLAGGVVAIAGSPAPVACQRDVFSQSRLFGWVAASGEWAPLGGKMVGVGVGDEAWNWAQGRVEAPAGNESYTFDFELVDGGGDPQVGRHGGVMFCASAPTRRFDPATDGYTLDWIDRAEDHGVRLLRLDRGVAHDLWVGTPGLAQPPANWRIALDAQRIKVYGDGALLIDVADGAYRSGYFGVWAFPGQMVRMDNLSFGTACAGLRRPFDLNQDGKFDVSDCVSLLGFLFLGNPARLPCGDGSAGDPANKGLADHNGDGAIDVSDVVAALSYLFQGGPPPRAGETCVPIEGCPAMSGGGNCN
jgi:hypothetical protein